MKLTPENVDAAHEMLNSGTHQILYSVPPGLEGAGTRYCAALITEGVRTFFEIRRADGESIRALYGSETQIQRRDVYSGREVAEMLRNTAADPASAAELAPLYGPRQLSTHDQLKLIETRNNQFRAAYGTAWQALDRDAMRAACDDFRAATRPWLHAERYTRADMTTIARNVRGEAHPPRFYARSRYRCGHPAKGFGAHVTAEKRLREGMAELAAVPGFTPRDRRQLVPVKLRNGRRYNIRRGELFNPLHGRFLHPINPKGQEMRCSVYREEVVAIMPERKREPQPC